MLNGLRQITRKRTVISAARWTGTSRWNRRTPNAVLLPMFWGNSRLLVGLDRGVPRVRTGGLPRRGPAYRRFLHRHRRPIPRSRARTGIPHDRQLRGRLRHRLLSRHRGFGAAVPDHARRRATCTRPSAWRSSSSGSTRCPSITATATSSPTTVCCSSTRSPASREYLQRPLAAMAEGGRRAASSGRLGGVGERFRVSCGNRRRMQRGRLAAAEPAFVGAHRRNAFSGPWPSGCSGTITP